jgi:adenylate cyclase
MRLGSTALATGRVERRLAAILAADVAGYSRLMGVDEEDTLRRLKALRRELADPKIKEHRGRIVKTTGDGLLLEFASVVDAVRCAVEVQREMAERNVGVPPDRRIEFRMGINVGDIIKDGRDIYGDGVNVAARLEALAEPGGICVSRVVRDQVRDKLAFSFEDMGEQQVKNIARPVRVHKIRLESAETPALGPEAPDRLGLATAATILGSGRKNRKAALAVLPFTVFGSDPEAEILADGLVEDMLTALARFRLVSIIARNSTFAYRGQQVDVRRVAAELGADYVLEGSVRRSGDNVRVSAQLIDAADGAHLWAERYDRRLEDLFAVQDVIAQAIVAGVEHPLVTAENRRGAPDPVGSTTDVIKAAGWYLFRFDQASNNKAISLLLSAVAENPAAYRRHQALAMGYCWQMAFGWTEEPGETAGRALAASEAAIRLNDEDAWNHCVLGWSAVYCDQFDRGIAAVERAVQINPHSAVTHGVRAWVLGHAGDSEDAIDAFATTARLGLQHPFIFMHATGVAWAHFAREAWEEAARHAETAALRRPSCFGPLVVLAAISGLRGDGSVSAQRAEAIRRLIPQFSLLWLGGFLHLRPTGLRDKAYKGLRAAGIE